MPILTIFVVLIVFGLAFWLVDALLPIPAPFKTAIKVLLVVVLIVWLLSLVGVVHLSGVRLR